MQLIQCGICPKALSTCCLLLLATMLHHGNWKAYQRATTEADSITPLFLASIYLYISTCLCVLFFFSPLTACLNMHVENTISPLTAQRTCCNHSSRKVGSPAETLPICGACLGPSHLNLAGLTWNSLPVGLPQTLPLSQSRRPYCKLQQLTADTPPESWLQLTSRYLSRKEEVICLLQTSPC